MSFYLTLTNDVSNLLEHMNIFDLKIKLYKNFEDVFGKNLVKRVSLKYYSFFVNKKGVLFIHIPKAAGTTICAELYGRRIGHYNYSDWEEFICDDATKNIKTFSVVRNPVKRIESAYKFVINGSNMGAVKNKKNYLENNSFRSFDAFIQEWLINQDLNTCDILFRPQFSFVCDKNYTILVDEVFKIEKTKLIEEYLSRTLCREVKLHKLNTTSNNQQTKTEYSKKTLEIINKLYAKDFELFDYE